MAALVLQGFAGLQPGRLLVCNRDPAKAAALAGRFRGEPVPFERLGDHLVAADIVLTSTGSCDPVITRAAVEGLLKRRRYRPMFLIDIAVPRDVEASVGELDRVYLYNLDDLQQVVQGTLSQRKGAIDAARAIVTRHVDDFSAWHRQREMGPAIDRLYRTFHDLAREELDRTLNKLSSVSAADRAQLEEMARRLVNKMLHRPVQTLRKSEGMHAGGTYLHAMEKLFHLDAADAAGEPSPAEAPAPAPAPSPADPGAAAPGDDSPARP
jgi:glutamyl-tRNA reductase